jgi:AcrR family transcriptional regulator
MLPRPPAPEPVEVKLLELAADQLRRFGVKRTTVVSIAAAAGMSHANVYRYFPSKTALVAAVLEQWLRPIEKGLRDIADGPDPARDKLERLLSAVHRAYRRKLDDDPEIFEIFSQATASGEGLARKHRNKVFSELHRIVEEGVTGDSFEVTDQRKAVLLIGDALARFLNPAQVFLDRDARAEELEGRRDRVIEMVLDNLAGPGARSRNQR